MLEQNRSATASAGSNMAGLRREDHYPEYRIGRVKHERIKVTAELTYCTGQSKITNYYI